MQSRMNVGLCIIAYNFCGNVAFNDAMSSSKGNMMNETFLGRLKRPSVVFVHFYWTNISPSYTIP